MHGPAPAIRTALHVLDVVWPRFTDRGGALLPAFIPAPEPPGVCSTFTEYEIFYSHTHVQDVFRWEVPYRHNAAFDLDEPDAATPEFALAWDLAQRMAAAWRARLAMDHPERCFRVYATKLADPIVRFHEVRAGEPAYLPDDAAAELIARDELVLFVTGD